MVSEILQLRKLGRAGEAHPEISKVCLQNVGLPFELVKRSVPETILEILAGRGHTARPRHHAGGTALAGCRTGGVGWAETRRADQPRPGGSVDRAQPRKTITRPNHLPGQARRLESIRGAVQRSLGHKGFDQRVRCREGNPSVRSRRRGRARYWVHCG